MIRIFLSYSHKDAGEIAEFLYTRLKGAGFEVWKDDHNLSLGSNFPKEIYEAVSEQDYFMPLISPAALESRWVQQEIGTAQALGKNITPILLEHISPPPFLSALHTLEMKKGIHDWMMLHKLVNHLEGGESIPRVYNMSGHTDIEVKGMLVLGHFKFKKVKLDKPGLIIEIARKAGSAAVPYIKKAGAGIVPHGHSTIACAILAHLLGTIGGMPKLYYPYRISDDKFGIDADTYIALQSIRDMGFEDRTDDNVQ